MVADCNEIPNLHWRETFFKCLYKIFIFLDLPCFYSKNLAIICVCCRERRTKKFLEELKERIGKYESDGSDLGADITNLQLLKKGGRLVM